MQYQVTQQVHSQQWDNDQQAIMDEMRQRAQHDLEVQNPGSTITIDSVEHTVRSHQAGTATDQQPAAYLVDFVFEYTASGQSNTFAA